MLGLVGKVVVSNKQRKEKLRELLDDLPETVWNRESSNVLAFVFFVGLLKEKEDKNGKPSEQKMDWQDENHEE